jgi:peroxiredoxin
MEKQPQYDVGDILPDLEVTNEGHQPSTLDEQMGHNGLLIFVLRGTWCPFCVLQIHKTQRRHQTYLQQGVDCVFIVPEDKDSVFGFMVSSRKPLNFGLHADENNRLADALTYKPETPSDRPLGIYLINPQRQIVWRYIGEDADTYPGKQEIIEAINIYLLDNPAQERMP